MLAGGARPALSLYLDVDPAGAVVATHSRCERVTIAANLRHGDLDSVFTEEALATGAVAHPFGAEIGALWRLAAQLQAARGKADAAGEQQRTEYNFYVDGGSVRIIPRRRGSPIDKLVAEMMIYANAEWGRAAARGGLSGGLPRAERRCCAHDDGADAPMTGWAWRSMRGRVHPCGAMST